MCGFNSHPDHWHGLVVQLATTLVLQTGNLGSTPSRSTLTNGRKPDNGSPERTANACREMIAVRVQFPLLPLIALVLKRNHLTLRTSGSRFESWPGYFVFADNTNQSVVPSRITACIF
jgi:hypothetical protein